jgi:signal transduction histidine kinase
MTAGPPRAGNAAADAPTGAQTPPLIDAATDTDFDTAPDGRQHGDGDDAAVIANGLKRSVQARDRLALRAELASVALPQQLQRALAEHDNDGAQAALRRNALGLAELAEDLRIYQAELHAQADELAASQARSDELLARFTTLFSRMPVAAMLVGDNGEVLEFNARAAALLQLPQRVAAARFLHRLVEPAHYQQRVRPAFHEARAAGASVVDAVRFNAAGAGFTGELHIAWLPGTPGGGAGSDGPYLCAVIDRTEHIEDLSALRASEEALRASRALLADSARLARIGGWALTLPHRQWEFSTELRRLLALPDDQPAGPQTLLALCAPAQREALTQALAAAEQGQAFELELQMTGGDGRPLRVLAVGHAEVHGHAEPDGHDSHGTSAAPRRITGVLQDITSSVLARQQISELTERLSVANAASGIGVWDWDTGRDTVIVDERMAQLIGLAAPGELPAAGLWRTLAAALPAEEAARLQLAISALVERAQPLALELKRTTADGGIEGWLHVTARLHREGAGGTLHVVGSAWDSSAEHEAARLLAAKESAEAASRSKSAFLSRMSHELRTPLNAILGFAQLMRLESEAGDLVLKPHRVQLIETAARHLLDLVNEVLDVSRIESGQLELRLSRLDLREVVRESLALVQGQAESAGVTLHDATAMGPPLAVLGDRLRLKEVLINLLSNGVKYNHPGGEVRVGAAARPEGGVLLQVDDTGRGLSAEQLLGLFQPFNRLGAEASGIEGTGMGLYVSRRFIELMGGEIEVASEPGRGSRFTVRLGAPPP